MTELNSSASSALVAGLTATLENWYREPPLVVMPLADSAMNDLPSIVSAGPFTFTAFTSVSSSDAYDRSVALQPPTTVTHVRSNVRSNGVRYAARGPDRRAVTDVRQTDWLLDITILIS